MSQDHWLPGFNFNVEEWDAKGHSYETLAICRTLALASAAFQIAIAEKTAGRFMIRSRTRLVRRHPKADWQRRPYFSPLASLRSSAVAFSSEAMGRGSLL